MTGPGPAAIEIEALVTDRYLDSLLAAQPAAGAGAEPLAAAAGRGPGIGPAGPPDPTGSVGPTRRADATRSLDPTRSRDATRSLLDRGVRLASERLTRDLPRFHPSFRFEERLALRLAEAAAAMRLPAAAGAEGAAPAVPFPTPELPPDFDPFLDPDAEEAVASPRSRPLLIGGAMAASAISLAGAAWVAWRRSRAGGPMARAVRAAHDLRSRPA